MQGKLLRVLQEGQYERIGEEKTSQVDVRVIAATNRNLAHEVEQGRFRRDLFYRLNVFPVDSPPLRQRTDDIPLLAAHIIERAATRLRLPVRQLTPRNVQELVGYDWPGNVRELQNIIERAMIRSETDRLDFGLAQGAAPPGLAEGSPAAGPDVGEGSIISEEEMRRRDRDNIVAALRRTDWQVYGRDGAAALLGMKPSTLASRLKKLGLEKPS